MKPLDLPEIPLPKAWNDSIKRGLLASFTLAHYTLVSIRAWGNKVEQPLVRYEIQIERLQDQVALLQEQLRIVTARAARAKSLPHYTPLDRFAILSVQQACGWSMAKAARQFLVAPQTIAQWHRKLDSDTLLEAPGEPVNKFPDFVTTLVQQLKTLFPLLGHRKIAEWLARGGLHLSVTTIRRMLKKPVQLPPRPKHIPFLPKTKDEATSVVQAQRPNHVWNVDISTIPTCWGLAISWWPTGFPALFPFCWKVIAVLDAYSRKVLATRICRKEPSGDDVVAALEAARTNVGQSPRHLVTDKGSQFFDSKNRKPAAAFKAWLDEYRVQPRFGAVGQKGSIALIERFWKTMKQESIRRILVPYDIEWIRAELNVFIDWYNGRRPHASLDAATPDERFAGFAPPSAQPRYEVRARYPIPKEDIDSGRVWRANLVTLDAECFKRRKHLPDVSLDVAA